MIYKILKTLMINNILIHYFTNLLKLSFLFSSVSNTPAMGDLPSAKPTSTSGNPLSIPRLNRINRELMTSATSPPIRFILTMSLSRTLCRHPLTKERPSKRSATLKLGLEAAHTDVFSEEHFDEASSSEEHFDVSEEQVDEDPVSEEGFGEHSFLEESFSEELFEKYGFLLGDASSSLHTKEFSEENFDELLKESFGEELMEEESFTEE